MRLARWSSLKRCSRKIGSVSFVSSEEMKSSWRASSVWFRRPRLVSASDWLTRSAACSLASRSAVSCTSLNAAATSNTSAAPLAFRAGRCKLRLGSSCWDFTASGSLTRATSSACVASSSSGRAMERMARRSRSTVIRIVAMAASAASTSSVRLEVARSSTAWTARVEASPWSRARSEVRASRPATQAV